MIVSTLMAENVSDGSGRGVGAAELGVSSEGGGGGARGAVGNAESFLVHSAPLVQRWGVDGVPYTVADVWHAFEEASTYGVGVPLCLQDGESAVQYYVPFLSAVQLAPLGAGLGSAQAGKGGRAAGGGQGFEFFERAAPYCRAPLAEKVAELAAAHPSFAALGAARADHLHPGSWFAVAWYPIYRIPTGALLRDLSACFLTFHGLSTAPGAGAGEGSADGSPRPFSTTEAGAALVQRRARASGGGDGQAACLLPFGFASYKMRGEVWGEPTAAPLSHLSRSARAFLQAQKVSHPDFEFFSART